MSHFVNCYVFVFAHQGFVDEVGEMVRLAPVGASGHIYHAVVRCHPGGELS